MLEVVVNVVGFCILFGMHSEDLCCYVSSGMFNSVYSFTHSLWPCASIVLVRTDTGYCRCQYMFALSYVTVH